jgi:hypothetical protein
MSDIQSPPLRASLEAVFVFVLAIAFLLVFSNTSGFEGDDLNSVLPMLHLGSALAGDLEIYRPDWQPLSYATGAAIFALTGSVDTIFALPALGVAIGIALLYLATRRIGLTPLLFVPLLMLFPEIVYTGLYYNSSALGFPFVCLAVLLAPKTQTHPAAVLLGAILAIAVLMRMDFVLIVPAILAYQVWFRREVIDLIMIGIGAGIVFGFALATNLLDPQGVINTYQGARDEIVARANQPGWDTYAKTFVATVVLSPLGWLFLFGGALYAMLNRRSWMPALIGLICLAPMLFAARNMLTPKYMIPAFALLPVIAAMIWVAATAQLQPRLKNMLTGVWIGATLFYFFLAIEPQRDAPFIDVSAKESRVINTHDGPRSWGAYLFHFDRVSTHWGTQVAQAEAILEATKAVGPIAFVGDQDVFSPGGTAWRHLQLGLIHAGYDGQVVAPGTLRFDRAEGPLFLLTPEAQASQALEGVCPVVLDSEQNSESILERIRAC